MTVTLTLDLPPDLAERLLGDGAARMKAATAVVQAFQRDQVLDRLRALAAEQREVTQALFAQWAEEDATDDPEEKERRDQEAAEIRRGLNANRRVEGARLLFPAEPD